MGEPLDMNAAVEAIVDRRLELKLRELEELQLPQWLNERHAAEYLDMSPKALANARRAGRVVGYDHGHKTGYIYARAELDRYARPGGAGARRRETSERQVVYFASRENLVKIGVSAYPQERVQDFGGRLLFVENTPSSSAFVLERELHERFRALATPAPREWGAGFTEWFRLDEPLVSYVAERTNERAAA